MTRLLHVIFLCALALWVGASVTRLVVGYDAFVPGTATLKSWYSPELLLHTIWLYTMLGAWTGWSFGVMVVGGLGFLLADRKQWKREGWMMMVTIFIIMLVPGQVWSILADVKLWNLYTTSKPMGVLPELTTVFLQRLTGTAYSIVNGLSVLMGLTIAGTIALRPLTNPTAEQHVEG
jgi:hypothetical protein